ncbi:VOC family protein [Aeromicrobium sp. UC242_57]
MIERARQAGARIVAEPAQQPWGYTGTFADPDGHLWATLAVGSSPE